MNRLSRYLLLAGLGLAPATAMAQARIVPYEAPANLPVKQVQAVPAQMPMAPTSPSPAPAAPSAAPAIVMPEPAPCTSGCEPAEEEQKPADKFFLEKQLDKTAAGKLLSDRGWRIYGWTQSSYNASSASRSNLPVPFIDRANEFSMMQNWLHVEKTIDTSKKEYQIGGVIDAIIPGTDSRFTLARGLFDEQNRNGDLYGFDLFQAYADVFLPNFGANGTTMRVGKFATFLEYEVVQGISNPFLSRSYLFQYNPFTHTGINFLTQLNDDWSMQNGVVLGSDNFIDPAARASYLGQLKWAPKDGKTSVAFGTTVTRPTYRRGEEFNFYNVYNLQVTHKITDKLSYVFDGSFSHIEKAPVVGSANWFGAVNYLAYAHTDRFTSNFRVELFNDTQGYRTGAEALYTAVTYGWTWKATDWFYLMPEVRYDYASKNGPFEGDRDLFTAAIGAILRW